MKGTVVMAYRYDGKSIVALQILRILRILTAAFIRSGLYPSFSAIGGAV